MLLNTTFYSELYCLIIILYFKDIIWLGGNTVVDFIFDVQTSLLYIINNINRKMILFIITDASGIQSISESVLKKLTCRHDVLLVDIGDANLAEKRSYSVDADHYVLDFLASNKKLRKLEQETKERIQKENESKLIQYRIVSSHIDTEEDIVEKVVDLLERHKYANIR